MLSDPQTVTPPTLGAQSLPRVKTDGTGSLYQKSDGNFILTIKHEKSGKTGNEKIRSVVRVDQRKVVADPLTNINDYQTNTVYVVFERPGYGFSSAEVVDLKSGLAAWLSDATVAKLYGTES